jgi:SRSO17 transposase
VVPLHHDCTGLLPGDRTSVEPMAALTAPARTAPKHQSLLHFVAIAPWSYEAVVTEVRHTTLPKIEVLGTIEASIVGDTGFPKQGKHSVGVAQLYCCRLASRTTARKWYSCPSPRNMPACPSPIGSICLRVRLESQAERASRLINSVTQAA